jgi:hypothetical protein
LEQDSRSRVERERPAFLAVEVQAIATREAGD